MPVSSSSAVDNRQLPVTALKGVGKAMAETLGRLGVATLGDLLLHMPVRYVKIGEVRPISDWNDGDSARVEVTVRKAFVRPGKRVKMVVAEAADAHGVEISLTWFGQHWLARQLPGKTVVCQGEIKGRSSMRMDVKEWAYADDVGDSDRGSSFRPIYPLTEGISQDRLRQLIAAALETCSRIPEHLPPAMRERYGLVPLRKALLLIHQPEQKSDPGEGRRRLVFDELFPSQLALLLLRRRDAAQPATALDAPETAAAVISRLPFRLSAGQERVWEKVAHHLRQTAPSRLLVQGDVGAGKTVIAALAASQAHAHGKLALVIVPTETLARQHADSLRMMLEPAGIQVECVIGSQSAREREAATAALAMGSANVAVGTHALLGEATARFAHRLALVVVDEQHRFGVEQRHQLVEQAAKAGVGIHLVQLSATPIPRTLAMSLFGDLDVLDLPLRDDARRQVKTVVIAKDEQWLAAVKACVERGDGAFVICPRIEDGDGRGVLSAQLAALLEQAGLRFQVAHGRQSAADRQQVLDAFAAGDLDVIVATTVIEVGIDIPRASTIAVLDAERFGLAQLHQLRGRVGRAGQKALCLLLPSKDAGPEGKGRLNAMTTLDDGRSLAEFDLRLRGSGAMLGDSQAGRSGLRIADLSRDQKTLAEARHAAKKLLEQDPKLAAPEHKQIKREIVARVSELLKVRQG